MTQARDPRPTLRRPLLDFFCVAAAAAAITAGLGGPGVVQASAGAAFAADGPVPRDTDHVVPGRAGDTLLWRDSLVEPAVVRPVNGVLYARLVVDTATLSVPDSGGATPMQLRTYRLAATTDPSYTPNDPRFTPRFPGPTFRIGRGDTVKIQLVNQLPAGGPREANDVCIQPTGAPKPGALRIPDVYQDCFHGPQFTNIHYHGMHVTPDSTSTVVGDDVLMAIAPGDSVLYSFQVPQNQSPGTHWYHPHKHGSVAIQVANGMAGAFLVDDGPLDSLVASLGMREHLIAIQQVAQEVGLLGGAVLVAAPLVNGQFRPTIYMAPGEVQRWRIVNENTTRTTKTFDVGFYDAVDAEEPKLFDIARDGVQFAPRNYDTVQVDSFLHMAPGQRLDVFVRAPQTAGTHLFQVAHNAGASRGTRDPTLPPDRDLEDTSAPPAVLLFYVRVDTSRTGNTTLPGALPPLPGFLSGDLAGARDTAVIVFTDSLSQEPTQFYLGSGLSPFQRFDDNSVFVPSDTDGVALPMVLADTQTWKIVNNSQQLINHPFHIHINPFQVDRVVYPLGTGDPFHALYEQLNAAADSGNPIWLDVLPLPLPDTIMSGDTIYGVPNTAYVVITQKYDDFQGCTGGSCGPPTGHFVMHCHILGHEERGMMQVLQVVEEGEPVTPPRGSGSHGAHPPASGSGPGGGHRH